MKKLSIIFIILILSLSAFPVFATSVNLQTPNGKLCPNGQVINSYNVTTQEFSCISVNGTGSNPFVTSSSTITVISSNNTKIGLSGSIFQAQGSTLADLHKMNNQTLYGMTWLDYLTIKENYQLQSPPCPYVNIRAETTTHELDMTDCGGNFVVLSQQTPYYYGVYPATNFHGIGFSMAQAGTKTPTQPYDIQSENYVRLPIYHGGEITTLQCNIVDNNENGITKISLDENGGPPPIITLSIPAGVWGTTYTKTQSINLNPGSQLTWVLDTSASTSGSISFFCNANP